jgi:6-pyruvoyltetrahydropterin/6-carboxytetrahydropterin synthase
MSDVTEPHRLSETYRVRVTKDHLVFSAGHFITFGTPAGPVCERIHGHNWRVAVEVEGPLDPNGYVFDFIALLDHSRAICLELDHRMLLPDGSGLIALEDDATNWRVVYDDRFWSFPKSECVILPIPNTTTEHIAGWFGERLIQSITRAGLSVPDLLHVEVEENFGQTAQANWRRQ